MKFNAMALFLCFVPALAYSLSYPKNEPLLYSKNLVFEGSFRLPGCYPNLCGGSSFDYYRGSGMAYNPTNNSLYIPGHVYQGEVAEVSIPALVPGNNVYALNTGTLIQPFADLSDNLWSLIGGDTKYVGGLLSYQGKMYMSVYVYYDNIVGNATTSHFVSGLDFSLTNDATGPFRIGNDYGAGFYAGYMADIPSEWKSLLGGPVLTGQCCLSIISRTSWGPAAFAIDPSGLGTTNPLPSVPLIVYPADHPLGDYDSADPLFNSATIMGGIAFPKGTRSVLFFGRHNTGPYCYGPGTCDLGLVGTDSGDGIYCYDCAVTSKGPHQYPYVYQVWAYDANDMAAVKDGNMNYYDIKPYATWTLDSQLPFTFVDEEVHGVAYDPATNRIFLSIQQGDAPDYPMIEVFDVNITPVASASGNVKVSGNARIGSN